MNSGRLLILCDSKVDASARADWIWSHLDRESTRAWLDRNAPNFPASQVSYLVDVVHEKMRTKRDSYVHFISDWAARPLLGGSPFRDRFLLPEGLSSWWYSDVFQKDTEAHPAFFLSCAGLCLLDFLNHAHAQFSECHVLGGREDWREWVQWTCGESSDRKMKIFFQGEAESSEFSSSSWRIFIREFRQWWASRLLQREQKDLKPEAAIDCAWLSLFPASWPSGSLDRFYGKLPEEVSTQIGKKEKHAYLFWVEEVSWKDLFRIRKKAVTIRSTIEKQGLGFSFLQNELKFMDLWAVLLDASGKRRYLKLEREKGFSDSFVWEGISLFPLHRALFRSSFMGGGVERCHLVHLAMQRAARKYRLRNLVTFLESYPFSRAVIHALRTAQPGACVFALQHAAISFLKLWYAWSPSDHSQMPLPDYFLVWGEQARKQILKNGFPSDRCNVIGAFRMAVTESSKSADNRLLVAGTFEPEDARQMAQLVYGLAPQFPEVRFAFRSHPHCALADFLPPASQWPVNVEVDGLPLIESIEKSRAVFSTYSTVLDEGYMRGREVVVLLTPDRACLSTFFESAGSARLVAGASDLCEVLNDWRKSGPFSPRIDTAWVDEVLGPRDGKAALRMREVVSKYSSKYSSKNES